MIKDFQIIATTFVTNTGLTGYYPVTKASLLSMSNTEYIDEVVVCDGQSIDDTVSLHSGIPKVKFITGPLWPLDSWTVENLLGLENRILTYVNEHENKNVISLLFSADTVWTDNFRDELHSYLEDLINSDKNYMLMPFSKTINYQFRTRIYDFLNTFVITSAVKFTPDTRWTHYTSETSIHGNKEASRLQKKFSHAPLSYDMFMFTKKNIADKQARYRMMNPNYLADPDEFIQKQWLTKVIGLEPTILSLNDHPLEAREGFINKLNHDHFGWDCFGHLRVEEISYGNIRCTII